MFELDRRKFLQAATAASLAGAGFLEGKYSAAADRPKRKFTLSLNCGSIGVKADPRQTIQLAHRYGYESVVPSASFLAKLSDGELQELLADLRAKKLVWGAVPLPVDFRGKDAKFSAEIKQLPDLAKGLQRAGASRVGTFLRSHHASLSYLANFRQHARRLREVAKVLADHGQRLGLEYVGPKTSWTSAEHAFVHTMAEAKELIAEIGQPNVGLVLDSFHWYTARETEADLLSLTNQDVVACDLNDAPQGVPVDQQMDQRRELPCATGVIDLKTFLGALLEMRYDGPIRAEPFDKALNNMPADQALAATAAAMRKAFALVE